MITKKQLGRKIRDLRLRFAITQDDLAKRLALKRQAIISIEKGDRDLSAVELARIAEIFDISTDDLFQKDIIFEADTPLEDAKKPFERERFKQLILYILEKCGAKPNVGETVLYKLLFYSDFDYFEQFNRYLSGARYIKNHFGPTPVEFISVVKEMINHKEIMPITTDFHGKILRKYMPLINYSGIFNDNEKKVIDEVVTSLSDKTATEISDYSHVDAPWALTEDGKVIDYKLVFDRKPPYTKHDYDTEFAQVGANDSFGNLPSLSQEEFDHYMNLPDKQ